MLEFFNGLRFAGGKSQESHQAFMTSRCQKRSVGRENESCGHFVLFEGTRPALRPDPKQPEVHFGR